MKKTMFYLALALALVSYACNSNPDNNQTDTMESQELEKIQLVQHEDQNKVDVIIDGQLFTSYIYPDTLEKPVLYPIKTASGKSLTRGFPLEPKAGERVDHPHHIGLWFNYGDVNGLDFWNNSAAVDPAKKDRYGTIYHESIDKVESGDDEAVLEVTSNWVAPNGDVLLKENTSYVFKAEGDNRIIDRITQLTAQDQEVRFDDNKEGMIAVRVTRALELPENKPQIYTDASGKPTDVPVLNNEGVNGDYLSSEGVKGGDVWGTRSKWVKLFSNMEGEPVSITIIDHPQNVGYPTYWHARGYGLFSANPLGQKVFSEGEEELNFKLEPQESVTFKHRIIVNSGTDISSEEINNQFDTFSTL
ncbi:MAG: PmoA family protein [Candidatus Cyclobacteriaceae bacterium M3_2C_046]